MTTPAFRHDCAINRQTADCDCKSKCRNYPVCGNRLPDEPAFDRDDRPKNLCLECPYLFMELDIQYANGVGDDPWQCPSCKKYWGCKVKMTGCEHYICTNCFRKRSYGYTEELSDDEAEDLRDKMNRAYHKCPVCGKKPKEKPWEK